MLMLAKNVLAKVKMTPPNWQKAPMHRKKRRGGKTLPIPLYNRLVCSY